MAGAAYLVRAAFPPALVDDAEQRAERAQVDVAVEAVARLLLAERVHHVGLLAVLIVLHDALERHRLFAQARRLAQARRVLFKLVKDGLCKRGSTRRFRLVALVLALAFAFASLVRVREERLQALRDPHPLRNEERKLQSLVPIESRVAARHVVPAKICLRQRRNPAAYALELG